MRLSDSVFYRDYNGKTFLVDTRQHRTYRFDNPISQLLDLFKYETSVETSKHKLLEMYPDVDQSIICDSIEKLVEFFSRNNMILKGNLIKTDVLKDTNPNTRFFQTYTIREKILYSALFELTYRCPERCIHCYLEPDSSAKHYGHNSSLELSTEEIKSALDQLSNLNVMGVTFTGGEPFVRSDIFDILDHAKKSDFLIDIFSNGILLNNDEIDYISRMYINCFHSSLYSHIPERHDSITGIRGSFQKTTCVLRSLAEKGVYVNIKFVLMEDNKNDFVHVVKFAESIGATCQLISYVSPSKNGNCGICNLSVQNDADLKNVLDYWNSISDFQPYAEPINMNFPICEAGRNSISIDPYGIVTPCNAFRYEIGSVRESTIKDIWEHSEQLKKWQNTSIKDLTECIGCKYLGYCSFCPGNALQYTGNMFGKVKEACRQARLQYELHTKTE